ncbi:MAG: 50S ribosomal protein L6 [Nanoarchaeota archaeon]|nr:50S ribosomal protein L6 [Nanoarchaeota archaeon]MBU1269143.1 50S ribosomal protein L6 [Nanoarchaeota archaeon]MBU1605105.1 50S ribosomal protein L6 [Nanoarchaeota archaeon]MBU2442786.1 50S ribosomal protein L6 [Nanoarchaeota archaeon]
MTKKQYEENLNIPDGIQVTFNKGVALVNGPKGELKKNLFNPQITFKVENNIILISAPNLTKKSKKVVNTFKAHLKNTFKGVVEGHTYKLKVCSGHFPMSVGLKGNTFEIKNFIGEKVPRTVNVLEGTTVKIDGSDVIVESIDKERAGQMAASIEQLTRRPGFDKRIFQDGIYIVEKDGKELK